MRAISTRGAALHYIAAVLKGERADESFRMRALEDALSDRWRQLSDEQRSSLQYVISNYPDLEKQSFFLGKILAMATMFHVVSCSPALPPVLANNPVLKQGAGFVFVCTEDRTILLAKRSKHVSEPGTWAGLGGRIEPGETPEEAAVREVEEEAGSMPSFTNILSTLYYEKNGLVFTTFIADLSKEEKQRWKPKSNQENDSIKWFDKLPDNLHPGLEYSLKAYLKSQAGSCIMNKTA